MALTLVQTLTSVGAAAETDIHTAVGDEQLVIHIVNESGGAGTITGLSISTTTITQNTAGNLLPTGEPIADGQTIIIDKVFMNTTTPKLVLKSSVAVSAVVSGWSDV